MRQRLKLLGYFGLFWLTFQIVIRMIFLVYNHAFTLHLSAGDIALIFLNGLKMDVSICGYFLMATGLILCVSVFWHSRWIYIMLNTLTVLILILSTVIVVADVELYRHWGFRLNTTPLFYIGPEAFGSIDVRAALNLSVIFVSLLAASFYIYRKYISPKVLHLHVPKKKTFVPLLIISGLMFIPIRGSFTVAPMNTGFVYFHKTNAFANHAAINVVWNFLYSLRKSANLEYPENFFDRERARSYFSELYQKADFTQHLLKSKRPNIVLFIVESFTADIIEPLGGMKGVAPNLSKLCSEGILFDNFYASGDRTDKGIVSVLSGFPAQPLTSIIKYPAKTQHLPYLTHNLQQLGYTTSFTYGGDIDFANLRSYLTNCRFDHITSEEDFPDELNYSKWGVHDHIMLEQAFHECDTARSPFFKTILTLSSHEPFDVPMSSSFLRGQDEESLFLNSCHYTDSALGSFIAQAKQKPWWDHTVFIFVADHGHRLPGNKEVKERTRFRIPLLMIGGAIAKDTVIHTYASQTDIANTLLAQLDQPSDAFTYSKNILAPNVKSFAAYFFNDGYGFVGPEKYIIYDNTGKQFLQQAGAAQEDLDISKAYQQILYSDYNKK
jgi:phosphoglycerol transferase MdoB-like AlkP superfamily enzyme